MMAISEGGIDPRVEEKNVEDYEITPMEGESGGLASPKR